MAHSSFLQEPTGGEGWGQRSPAPAPHQAQPARCAPSACGCPAPPSGLIRHRLAPATREPCGGAGWGGAALTGPQLLLQEADLLAQGVDAVQLLEGVDQQAAGVREPTLQCPRGQAVQWGQHQLQLLWAGRGPGWGRGRAPRGQPSPSVPRGFKAGDPNPRAVDRHWSEAGQAQQEVSDGRASE